MAATKADGGMERTLAILKPDAVARGICGEIISLIERAEFSITALRLLRLTREQAAQFYAVHAHRPFYGSLCQYMSSGPVVVAVLQADRAIERWRQLMGATDPAKAAAGSIRQRFGLDVERNAVHGSDGLETAQREIGFFFSALDLLAL